MKTLADAGIFIEDAFKNTMLTARTEESSEFTLNVDEMSTGSDSYSDGIDLGGMARNKNKKSKARKGGSRALGGMWPSEGRHESQPASARGKPSNSRQLARKGNSTSRRLGKINKTSAVPSPVVETVNLAIDIDNVEEAMPTTTSPAAPKKTNALVVKKSGLTKSG